MLAETHLRKQSSAAIEAMRETTFLVALVSYMVVVMIGLAALANHLGT